MQTAKLGVRLDTLVEMKNIQNQWIKNYQKEIDLLDEEVGNIKAIADALPAGCFKRTRLEP